MSKEYINEVNYIARILSFKYNVVSHKEDLIQEGYFGYINGLKSYNYKKGGLNQWLNLCIRNSILKYIFKEFKFNHTELWDDFYEKNHFDENLAIDLEKAFKKLNNIQLRVLSLRINEGYNFRDISKKLKLPYVKMTNHYKTAVQILKNELGVYS